MSGRPRSILAGIALAGGLLGAGAGAAATSGGGGDGDGDGAPGAGASGAVTAGAPRAAGAGGAAGASRAAGARPLPPHPSFSRTPHGGELLAARTAEARRGGLSAHLERPAILRDAPAGRPVARVARRTGYGARRVFAAAAFEPGWVGVRAVQRPNTKLGWLPEEAVRVEPVRTTLVADLSDRELTLRVDGKLRHRLPIGIGRPGSETPVGRYGVTDRLKGGGGAGAYGCCVIPLTGHQTKLPPGWTGGTRLALHGTPSPGSVGQEVSAGCLRMRDGDISRLLPDVPLGATLVVRH